MSSKSSSGGGIRLVAQDDAADGGGLDALVLTRISEMLPSSGGMVPARARLLRILWSAEDYPGDEVLMCSIWRLIARGSLKPCLRGDLLHVTTATLWAEGRLGLGGAVASMTEREARDHSAAQCGSDAVSQAPRARNTRSGSRHPEASHADDEKELFDLQVALDVEAERALLYRVAVVMEAVFALVLVRQAVMAWLGY